MSRSYKKLPPNIHREPKGHKNAVINECRAIPPDAWEDINHDSACYLPFKAAKRMAKQGISAPTIVKKIQFKFCLTTEEAMGIVRCVTKRTKPQ